MSLQPIRERLRRFRALSRQERGVFLRAAALLPVVCASLRFVGFGRTQRALQRFLKPNGRPILAPGDSNARIEATHRMVQAAARYSTGKTTCLEESLVLWWLLGRQGITAQVRIGARKAGEKFEAHAWVECGGGALNDPGELHRHYSAFDASFPATTQESP